MLHHDDLNTKSAGSFSTRGMLAAAVLVASSLLLSACGGDSNDQTQLRVIHASPDAPKVNVLLDDEPLLTEVNYKDGSGFTAQSRGTYDVSVDAITPGGDVTVINVPNVRARG